MPGLRCGSGSARRAGGIPTQAGPHGRRRIAAACARVGRWRPKVGRRSHPPDSCAPVQSRARRLGILPRGPARGESGGRRGALAPIGVALDRCGAEPRRTARLLTGACCGRRRHSRPRATQGCRAYIGEASRRVEVDAAAEAQNVRRAREQKHQDNRGARVERRCWVFGADLGRRAAQAASQRRRGRTVGGG